MGILFSEEDRRLLGSVARESIESKLSHRPPRFPDPTEGCLRGGGLFVTLRKKGRLRGCVGRMQGDMAVYETVKIMAAAAAFEDPRFPPLSRAEMGEIDIEITLLGPLEKIREAGEIVIGRHGLYIIDRGRAGVLLPQVATEYGWDAPAFLDNVCLKAGLPSSAWKSPEAQLYVFEGLVFPEKA